MTGLRDYLATRADRCPHGWNLDLQGCMDCGLSQKFAGQSATTAAHPTDRAAVEAAIRKLAATGEPFSANSARPLHGVTGPVVGATFTALAKAGVIRRIGYVASTDPGTHAHPVAEWVGRAA